MFFPSPSFLVDVVLSLTCLFPFFCMMLWSFDSSSARSVYSDVSIPLIAYNLIQFRSFFLQSLGSEWRVCADHLRHAAGDVTAVLWNRLPRWYLHPVQCSRAYVTGS